MSTDDRRKSPRISSVNLISYACLDQNNREYAHGMGRTLNLTEDGMLLETHFPIENGCIVSLQLGLGEEIIDFRGKVVHQEPAEGELFTTGIEFLDKDSETLDKLRQFVKAFKKQGP